MEQGNRCAPAHTRVCCNGKHQRRSFIWHVGDDRLDSGIPDNCVAITSRVAPLDTEWDSVLRVLKQVRGGEEEHMGREA